MRLYPDCAFGLCVYQHPIHAEYSTIKHNNGMTILDKYKSCREYSIALTYDCLCPENIPGRSRKRQNPGLLGVGLLCSFPQGALLSSRRRTTPSSNFRGTQKFNSLNFGLTLLFVRFEICESIENTSLSAKQPNSELRLADAKQYTTSVRTFHTRCTGGARISRSEHVDGI